MTQSFNIDLADYDISPLTGFMPYQRPLRCLKNSYYAPWEKVISGLTEHLETGQLGREIDRMPLLDTHRLSCEAEWRRAYVILSFLAQGYIWERHRPRNTLPLCIAKPLTDIAEHLDITPCVTYAAVCLWNLRQESTHGYCRSCVTPESFSAIHTFTGSKDEEWFYAVSAAIETQGAGIIPQILTALDAVQRDDIFTVQQFLDELCSTITEITRTLDRMHAKCRPDVFYDQLRPFLSGSRNAASSGLPDGVYYPDVDKEGSWRKYYGGSNAQSTLIQLFDVVLGIQHGGDSEPGKPHYLQEVRDYMPGKHRNFLIAMEQRCNFRSYARRQSKSSDVWKAYENAVSALTGLRNTHIRIVSRYIILPAGKNRTVAPKVLEENDKQKTLKGTGGTELTDFLRGTRDTTANAACLRKGS